MATSKYSHFCASRMIQYGTPDVKADIIESVYGNILKMINNAQAAGIIDTIYISWASSQQKAAMRQELFGDLYKKVIRKGFRNYLLYNVVNPIFYSSQRTTTSNVLQIHIRTRHT